MTDDHTVVKWVYEYALKHKLLFIADGCRSVLSEEEMVPFEKLEQLSTLDGMVIPPAGIAPDYLQALPFFDDVCGDDTSDSFQQIREALITQAMLAPLREGDEQTPIETYDVLFPKKKAKSAGKDDSDRSTEPPEALTALKNALSKKKSKSRKAVIANALSENDVASFQEMFALYLQQFKTAFPPTTLERFERGLLDGDFVLSNTTVAARRSGNESAQSTPKPAKAKKSKNKQTDHNDDNDNDNNNNKNGGGSKKGTPKKGTPKPSSKANTPVTRSKRKRGDDNSEDEKDKQAKSKASKKGGSPILPDLSARGLQSVMGGPGPLFDSTHDASAPAIARWRLNKRDKNDTRGTDRLEELDSNAAAAIRALHSATAKLLSKDDVSDASGDEENDMSLSEAVDSPAEAKAPPTKKAKITKQTPRTQTPRNKTPLSRRGSGRISVRRPWTQDEVDSLNSGVLKYGKGKWAEILATYDFGDRTSVDLKDKWRNLEKAVNRARQADK